MLILAIFSLCAPMADEETSNAMVTGQATALSSNATRLTP